MTTDEAEHLVQTIQLIDPSVIDLEDTILLARSIVPKIDYDTYHGVIHNNNGEAIGVFRSNDYESRWFPGMSLEMVAHIIGEETL